MKVLVVLLVLVGTVGFAFASHDPDQPYTHSIVLPDMQEKTFEEFMDWCVPFYGEKCTKFYIGTSTLPPLKQIQLETPFNKIQCRDELVLVQKYDGSPACVTESTKQKLIERGWTKSSTWTVSYEIPTVIIPLGSSYPELQKNFEPQIIKIVLGVNNTIRWINQDDVPSSVTSDHEYDGYGFVSPHLKPGDSWSHTFTKAGTYDYHSIPHPWKNGKVIVLGDNVNQNDLQKQNIIRIEDGRISLYPESTCASISLELLAEKDIQRYKNDERGLNATNVLPITADDFDEIPILEELIYAVNLLEFPYNEYSSAYLDGLTFVEYEFFLMDKAIQKYGDSQDDYFEKLDKDYEERFSNPKKQGFTNRFEAPLITYDNKTYSIGGTKFWTSDEHKPMRMTVKPIDEIKNGDKVINLTDEDMKSIPKIKQAIKEIGTIKESILGTKGVSEGTQNEYMQWLEEKSQERLGSDRFRLVEYDNQFYAISFLIC